MKNSIKYAACFLVLTILAMLAPPRVKAQSPVYAAQSLGIPGTIAAATVTNGLGLILDLRKQKEVALEFHPGVGSNMVYRFSASVSGVTYKTNAFVITSIAPSTSEVMITNINVQGVGFLRLDSIANGHGTIVSTNGGAYYSIKIQAP